MLTITIQGNDLEELKKDLKSLNDTFNRVEVTEAKEETDETILVTDEDIAEIGRIQEVIKEQEADDSEEVDKEGIPWDARIHSGSHNKTVKGIWKKRKGVDEAVFNKVKAELMNDYAGEEVKEVTPTVVEEVKAPSTTTKTPELPSMNTNAHSLATFTQNFAMVLAQLVTAGKLTEEYIQQLKTHFGVNEIWEASEDQIKATFDLLVKNNILEQVG